MNTLNGLTHSFEDYDSGVEILKELGYKVGNRDVDGNSNVYAAGSNEYKIFALLEKDGEFNFIKPVDGKMVDIQECFKINFFL